MLRLYAWLFNLNDRRVELVLARSIRHQQESVNGLVLGKPLVLLARSEREGERHGVRFGLPQHPQRAELGQSYNGVHGALGRDVDGQFERLSLHEGVPVDFDADLGLIRRDPLLGVGPRGDQEEDRQGCHVEESPHYQSFILPTETIAPFCLA